jgi:hypothetical protein
LVFVELVVEAYALVVQIVLTIVEAKMLGVAFYDVQRIHDYHI